MGQPQHRARKGRCEVAGRQVTPKGREDEPRAQNDGRTRSNCCGCNVTASQNLTARTPATQSVPNSSSSYGDEVG
jgi:hypothetical protein